MKAVLIINGHPDHKSYNHALATAYRSGINPNEASIQQINIVDLDFNPNLQYGYRQRTELEPDLVEAIEKIRQADHLVWVFPMWWYGAPALMKGFIDRAFLPGIAYEPVEDKALPIKLFKGKSARVIITADTPSWYDYLFMKRPAINQFKKGTLEFCGVSPVKITYIAPIKNSSDQFRENWLKKIKILGEKLK